MVKGFYLESILLYANAAAPKPYLLQILQTLIIYDFLAFYNNKFKNLTNKTEKLKTLTMSGQKVLMLDNPAGKNYI